MGTGSNSARPVPQTAMEMLMTDRTDFTLLKLPALPSLHEEDANLPTKAVSFRVALHHQPWYDACCAQICHLGDEKKPESLISVLYCGSPSREA